jgi:hypothetical protein
MAFGHGHNGVFKLDNSGGSLTTLSAYVESLDSNFGIADHPTQTLGDTAEESILGLKNGTFNVSFVYDSTAWTHITGIYGLSATVTFNIAPEGTGTTTPLISGEARLLSFTMPVNVNDKLQFTANFKLDGAPTFGTNP